MAQKATLKPWHEVVRLRDDLKSGELSLAVFAADLYDVVMQKGQRPVYENPSEFLRPNVSHLQPPAACEGRLPASRRQER